jgi:hypothetical protein
MPWYRNPVTGKWRRRAARDLPRKRRAGALDVNSRDCLVNIVHPAIQNWTRQSNESLTMMFLLFWVKCNASIYYPNYYECLHEVVGCIDKHLSMHMCSFAICIMFQNYWITMDSAIGDIPEEEETEEVCYSDPKYQRIDDFMSPDQAKIETGFTKDELRLLIDLFALPLQILVPRPDGKTLTFHREELLIFTLCHLKEGDSIVGTVSRVVGGRSEARWGYGYKWMIHYLDQRYHPILSHEGLERWVTHFPMFAEKIRVMLEKDKRHVDPETYQVEIEDGVYFPPGTFSVVGVVDCKEYHCLRPHSGPAGNYPGAMRRPHWYEIQRAFYTGRKKKHALKVISFCLPNGITAALYGPTSARRHDTTLLAWSGIDHFLTQIQLGQQHSYAFYGDSAFQGPWTNIRTRHKATELHPLTQQEEDENKAMKKVRESIEWEYGSNTVLWKLASNKHRFKLETDPQVVMAQVRVMQLLTNCYTCLHGSNISSRYTFDCPPPSLQSYLTL